MKVISTLIMALLCLSSAAQSGFITDFQQKWQGAWDYTIEFAEAMPAKHYDYRPNKEERTYREQLIHMAGNMLWLGSDYLGAPDFDWDVDNPPEEKEELIRYLDDAFSHISKAVANFNPADLNDIVQFFAGPMSKRRVFFLLSDHVTHHRGQLVVYLRLKGIEPPRYRGW